jgi:hypothetical protein
LSKKRIGSKLRVTEKFVSLYGINGQYKLLKQALNLEVNKDLYRTVELYRSFVFTGGGK